MNLLEEDAILLFAKFVITAGMSFIENFEFFTYKVHRLIVNHFIWLDTFA